MVVVVVHTMAVVVEVAVVATMRPFRSIVIEEDINEMRKPSCRFYVVAAARMCTRYVNSSLAPPPARIRPYSYICRASLLLPCPPPLPRVLLLLLL